MNLLEVAASRSRWAHVSVGEKILAIIGLLFLAVSVPPLPVLPLVALAIYALAYAAKVPPKLYIGLIFAPAGFVALGLWPLMFSITLHGIVPIEGGITDAATVLARSIVAMSATMLFALTTPMASLLVWMRAHGVPPELAHVIMVTYRMIGTLIHTARTMWDAQAQRLGHSSTRRWISSVAAQAASLFVISLTRARALQEGLELRAHLGATDTMDVRTPARPAVLAATAAGLLLLTALAIYTR